MKSIVIRDLEITPPLSLAPMVGLSHSALRSLTRELGGVGLLFTEMLAARRLPHDNENISPFLIKSPIETPLFYQLYLSDEKDIAPAVEKIEKLEGQGVDLNLGCPAPKLRKQGAGVYLSNNLDHVKTVVDELRRRTELPLSAKIRIGEELNKERLENFCKLLEDCGVDLITVHARLNGEKFCRKPRWEWVKVAKDVVNIPVFANGGIFSVEDAKMCLKLSNADGLMLGRGAAIRPWLFEDIKREIYGDKTKHIYSKENVFNRFVEIMEERFPKERQLGRLKQFTTLYAESFTYGHQLATAVQRSNSMQEAKEKAAVFFAK